MHKIHKHLAVTYTASQMYTLISHVQRYPAFLKWCQKASVQTISDQEVYATLWIAYHGISHPFTTHNSLQPNQSITMTLVEGPFRHLEGAWCFDRTKAGCHITFDLAYEFSSPLWHMLLAPIFQRIANNLIRAFTEEARQRYR